MLLRGVACVDFSVSLHSPTTILRKQVLVATDVLARGIDVPAVTLVVNYEIPVLWDKETAYRKRICFYQSSVVASGINSFSSGR